MRLKTLAVPIFLLALAGCGGDDGYELEKGPSLFNDRNELLFATEFGSGTYVGTTGFESLIVENRGDEPLVITEVTKSGPAAFTLRLPEGLAEGKSVQVESRKKIFIEVQFKPTQATTYEGKLTIKSNSTKDSTKDIRLFGKGVPPP